jgi:hypothetical protein
MGWLIQKFPFLQRVFSFYGEAIKWVAPTSIALRFSEATCDKKTGTLWKYTRAGLFVIVDCVTLGGYLIYDLSKDPMIRQSSIATMSDAEIEAHIKRQIASLQGEFEGYVKEVRLVRDEMVKLPDSIGTMIDEKLEKFFNEKVTQLKAPHPQGA